MNKLETSRLINRIHIDPGFHRFINQVMGYCSHRAISITSLESYPRTLDSQGEHERKILARHEDTRIYGSNFDDLSSELESGLNLEYEIFRQYLHKKKLELEAKKKEQRFMMRGYSATKNAKAGPIGNVNGLLTLEILSDIDEGHIILYAYHIHSAMTHTSAKKVRKGYMELLDKIYEELKKRGIATDPKVIFDRCMTVSDSVKNAFMQSFHISCHMKRR